MITSMHIENFKCFKDFDIDLGPFTVLVGQNDSGKTAFLQAIQLVGKMMPGIQTPLREHHNFLGVKENAQVFWRNSSENRLCIRADASPADRPESALTTVLKSDKPQDDPRLSFYISEENLDTLALERSAPEGKDWKAAWLSEAIGRPGYYRFDPRGLKLPSKLGAKPFELLDTGRGLPNLLNAIWGADRDAFLAVENAFYERFHEYTKLVFEAEDCGNGEVGQALRFDTRHGEHVPAYSVSDGAITSLAYLAIAHIPNPPKILLIEEPENGVHHARLEEIIGTLRELSRDKGTQVILTTHSPYLLDLAEPEEVRVFVKDEEGAVHARKLSDFDEVDSLKKHFMTGEIWTALSETERI